MLVVRGETYLATVYKRVKNSPYEYESEPFCTFKCRPANSREKKTYRLLQGVNTNNDSVFLITSNLPEGVDQKDRVVFLGDTKTCESVGYYFDSNQIVNAKIMSDQYILSRCPKGIVIG